MFRYIPATLELQERKWQKTVDAHPGDARWDNWRTEYRQYYASGMARHFVVVDDDDPVGEGTLLFSPDCNALEGRSELAQMGKIANINGLRIEKQYEGQGHISKLVKAMEEYATQQGYKLMTIGVTNTHTRTKAIYNHLGYTQLVLAVPEDDIIVEYLGKELK